MSLFRVKNKYNTNQNVSNQYTAFYSLPQRYAQNAATHKGTDESMVEQWGIRKLPELFPDIY